MSSPSYKKILRKGTVGLMREEVLDLLPSTFFEDPVAFVQERRGRVVRDSRLRWAAVLPLSDGRRIFLKRDRTKGWIESLKYVFLPSKGRKEWLTAYRLTKGNLHVPQPLGWMERVHRGFVKESYYLAEAIGTGVSFSEDPVQLGKDFSIDELAKTVRKVHDSGLFHQDLHAGNFLWDGSSFCLTDLHRAKILKYLSLNKRLWNVSLLFHSMRSTWGEEDQVRFIERYFEGEPLSHQTKGKVIRTIHSLMDRLQKRRWGSRTKRCLKESSEFAIGKEGGISYYRRRDFPIDHLRKAIEEHSEIVRQRPWTLAKNSPETVVSLFHWEGRNICVKEFRYSLLGGLKECFRTSKGLKAWIAGNGLRVRGIPCVRSLGLMERRNGIKLESFFVMEACEAGEEMDRYLITRMKDFRVKRIFIKCFARWFAELHRLDLYHRDMKTCNVLVAENGKEWNFYLLDLEDLRLGEKVGTRKLSRNLVQLNASIPKTLARTDRLRFFHQYLIHRPVSLDERRLIRQVVQETSKRGVVYVAPWGVVEENSAVQKGG